MRLVLFHGKNQIEATQIASRIQWSGETTSCARELSATLAVPGDLWKKIELMDAVILQGERGQLFSGMIWRRERDSNRDTMDITAFDNGLYLKKNKDSYKVDGSTAEDLTRRICADYGIGIGAVEPTGVAITANFLGKDLYSMIQSAYTQASKTTGRQYAMRFHKNKLFVRARGVNADTVVIEQGRNLINAHMVESAEDIITRVKIFDKDDNLVRVEEDAAAVSKYGVLQNIVQQTAKTDGSAEATQLLQKSRFAQIDVTNIGDERCVTGEAVLVLDRATKARGIFYIDSDVHTWESNGVYQNALTLNFQNLMDEVDLPNG